MEEGKLKKEHFYLYLRFLEGKKVTIVQKQVIMNLLIAIQWCKQACVYSVTGRLHLGGDRWVVAGSGRVLRGQGKQALRL